MKQNMLVRFCGKSEILLEGVGESNREQVDV